MTPPTEQPTGERTRPLLVALFMVYLVLLTWTVVWKLAVPWVGAAALLPHPVKLMPFLPDGEADGSAPLEVAANILLFLPFGIYLGLLALRWKWWHAAAVLVGASLVLETAQLVLSTGSFDTTDVITNTAGGMLGLGVVALVRRSLHAHTRQVFTRILVVGTVLLLIAVATFVVSPLRYSPQQDVVVERR